MNLSKSLLITGAALALTVTGCKKEKTMADIKKIKVGNTTYDIKDDTKLPKVTYE